MRNFKNGHYVEFLITFLNYSNYDTILIDNYKTIFSDCSNLFTRKLSTMFTNYFGLVWQLQLKSIKTLIFIETQGF